MCWFWKGRPRRNSGSGCSKLGCAGAVICGCPQFAIRSEGGRQTRTIYVDRWVLAAILVLEEGLERQCCSARKGVPQNLGLRHTNSGKKKVLPRPTNLASTTETKNQKTSLSSATNLKAYVERHKFYKSEMCLVSFFPPYFTFSLIV